MEPAANTNHAKLLCSPNYNSVATKKSSNKFICGNLFLHGIVNSYYATNCSFIAEVNYNYIYFQISLSI